MQINVGNNSTVRYFVASIWFKVEAEKTEEEQSTTDIELNHDVARFS